MRANRVCVLAQIAKHPGGYFRFKGMRGMLEWLLKFELIEPPDPHNGKTSITTRGLCALEVAAREHARHGRDHSVKTFRHPDGSVRWSRPRG